MLCRNHQEIPNKYKNVKKIPELPKCEFKKSNPKLRNRSSRLRLSNYTQGDIIKWFKFIQVIMQSGNVKLVLGNEVLQDKYKCPVFTVQECSYEVPDASLLLGVFRTEL